MDCRTTVEHLNYYAAAPLGIFFNLVALYIIRKGSILELSSYKLVLLATTYADLFIATYSFLIDLVSFVCYTCNIIVSLAR